VVFSWEIIWKSDSTKNTQTAEFQTSNNGGSTWSAVGSDITTTSTADVRTRTTFTPTDGNLYRVVVKTASTKNTVFFRVARIIVTQTASPTKHELQYLMDGNLLSITDAAATPTKWDSTEWSGVSNTYKFAADADSSASTDVASIYDASNTIVSGSTATVSAANSQGLSSSFSMPSNQNIHCVQTSGGGSIDAGRLIVIVTPAAAVSTPHQLLTLGVG